MAIQQISPIIMASMSTYDRSKSKREKEEARGKKPEMKKEEYAEIRDVYTPSGADDMMRQMLRSYVNYSSLRK